MGLSNETPWGLSKFLELSKEKNFQECFQFKILIIYLNRTYEVGLAEMSVREKLDY